ncbi:MAG: hypothetical protein WC326_13065 [Candidatus Delongbacteria bacterium]
MSEDMREQQRRVFQVYLDRLHEDPGCEVGVTWVADRDTLVSFSAGMRVLSATPLFNRATGEIERWRHWLLFAEMGILDTFGGGHPVHCFECELLEQDALHVRLREVGGTYEFLICHNDPHDDDERQAAVYHDWAQAVKELGGEPALQALLDRQAEQWTQTLRTTGEMKP